MKNGVKIVATSLGAQVLTHLIGRDETYIYIYILNSTFWSSGSYYTPNCLDINYVGNPWYNEIPYDGGVLNSMVAMGHETFHAFDHSYNTGGAFVSDAKIDASASMLEERAVSFTNYLRGAYGLTPYRNKYGTYKENFFQFSSNPSESISNFTSLGGNKDGTSYGFSYTKTVTQSEAGQFELPAGNKKTLSQNNYYIVVSTDKDKNVTYKIYNNEDEYKKAIKGW